MAMILEPKDEFAAFPATTALTLAGRETQPRPNLVGLEVMPAPQPHAGRLRVPGRNFVHEGSRDALTKGVGANAQVGDLQSIPGSAEKDVAAKLVLRLDGGQERILLCRFLEGALWHETESVGVRSPKMDNGVEQLVTVQKLFGSQSQLYEFAITKPYTVSRQR